MVQVNFAADAANTGYDAVASLYSTGISLPTGRTMANGSTGCLINALYGYVAGRGASRTVSMTLGSAATSAFGVASSSSAQPTGWISAGPWLVSGGSANFYIYISGSGSVYFGRSSTSGAVNTYDGGPGFTGTLAGWYQYIQSPPAMSAPSVSASGSTITVTLTPPSDSGDGTISGYAIQYSKDPTFATATTATTTATTSSIVGLASGRWYVRVSSSNECTAAASTYAPWSTATAQQVGIGGVRQQSGAEVALTVGKRWSVSAGAEATLTTAVRWDAASGTEIPL